MPATEIFFNVRPQRGLYAVVIFLRRPSSAQLHGMWVLDLQGFGPRLSPYTMLPATLGWSCVRVIYSFRRPVFMLATKRDV